MSFEDGFLCIIKDFNSHHGILIMDELCVSDEAGGVLNADNLSFEPSSKKSSREKVIDLGFTSLTCECQTRSGQTDERLCYSDAWLVCCYQSNLLHWRSPTTGPDG